MHRSGRFLRLSSAAAREAESDGATEGDNVGDSDRSSFDHADTDADATR